jgi:hypothetical protein
MKGIDNQTQKLNNQINQYPNKIMIVSLGDVKKTPAHGARKGPSM